MKHVDGALGFATYSDDMLHRYTLGRFWDASKPGMQFIGLNPSTATHDKNDPTITRIIDFAKQWGYGSLLMTNLFSYRATDPFEMMRVIDPTGGEQNDAAILGGANTGRFIVAGWGVHGSWKGRDHEVKHMLRGHLHHMGLTKHGHPRHPLYLAKSTKVHAWLPNE